MTRYRPAPPINLDKLLRLKPNQHPYTLGITTRAGHLGPQLRKQFLVGQVTGRIVQTEEGALACNFTVTLGDPDLTQSAFGLRLCRGQPRHFVRAAQFESVEVGAVGHAGLSVC